MPHLSHLLCPSDSDRAFLKASVGLTNWQGIQADFARIMAQNAAMLRKRNAPLAKLGGAFEWF